MLGIFVSGNQLFPVTQPAYQETPWPLALPATGLVVGEEGGQAILPEALNNYFLWPTVPSTDVNEQYKVTSVDAPMYRGRGIQGTVTTYAVTSVTAPLSRGYVIGRRSGLLVLPNSLAYFSTLGQVPGMHAMTDMTLVFRVKCDVLRNMSTNGSCAIAQQDDGSAPNTSWTWRSYFQDQSGVNKMVSLHWFAAGAVSTAWVPDSQWPDSSRFIVVCLWKIKSAITGGPNQIGFSIYDDSGTGRLVDGLPPSTSAFHITQSDSNAIPHTTNDAILRIGYAGAIASNCTLDWVAVYNVLRDTDATPTAGDTGLLTLWGFADAPTGSTVTSFDDVVPGNPNGATTTGTLTEIDGGIYPGGIPYLYAVTSVNAPIRHNGILPGTVTTYAVASINAPMLRSRLLTPTAQTYAVTSVAAGLNRGKMLAPTPQTYAVTSVSALLERGYRQAPTPQSYTVTSINAPRGFGLIPTPQTYAVTPVSALLERGYKVPATVTTYAVTSIDAPLKLAMYPTPQTYTVTSITAPLKVAHTFAPTPQSYTVTSISASMNRGKLLAPSAQTYAVTSVAATFKRTYVASTLAPATYAVTSVAAGLNRGRKVVATVTTYAVSSIDAPMQHGYRYAPTAQTYAVTSVAMSFKRTYRAATAAPASYAVASIAAPLLLAHKVVATVTTYAVTSVNTVLSRGRFLVPAAPGAYALTGIAAPLRVGHRIALPPASYIVTSVPFVPHFVRRINATPTQYFVVSIDAPMVAKLPESHSAEVIWAAPRLVITPVEYFPEYVPR